MIDYRRGVLTIRNAARLRRGRLRVRGRHLAFVERGRQAGLKARWSGPRKAAATTALPSSTRRLTGTSRVPSSRPSRRARP
jgi:hypothetical protein